MGRHQMLMLGARRSGGADFDHVASSNLSCGAGLIARSNLRALPHLEAIRFDRTLLQPPPPPSTIVYSWWTGPMPREWACLRDPSANPGLPPRKNNVKNRKADATLRQIRDVTDLAR